MKTKKKQRNEKEHLQIGEKRMRRKEEELRQRRK
jgi:hypothetical protein